MDTIATIKIPLDDNSTEVKPIFAIPKYPTYVGRNDVTIFGSGAKKEASYK
ncbi:hypothetical protein PDK32_29410 [Bacillus cereus]|nr:hypothetical protein [Bacillus cereus]